MTNRRREELENYILERFGTCISPPHFDFNNWSKSVSEWCKCIPPTYFRQGAEWADANPILPSLRRLDALLIEKNKLTESVRILTEALEFYAKGGSMTMEPIKPQTIDEIQDMIMPLYTITLVTKTAREALAAVADLNK